MTQADEYKNVMSPLVVPFSLLSSQVKKDLKRTKILDFGVGIRDNFFKFYKSCSYIPKLYTVAYALAIAASGKAKKIYLAGFDGYDKSDRRLKIIDEIFQNFSKAKGSIEVIAVTPTIYNIQKRSVYTL